MATFALAIFVLAPISAATAAPSNDLVTGTGTLGAEFGSPTVHVNAIQTNAGLRGSFTITYPDGTFITGTVSCLVINGTTAYVTGVITASGGPRQSTNNWSPGNYLFIGVQDNGEPGTGTSTPDQANFSQGFAGTPVCGPDMSATPTLSAVTGNFQVFDAP